MSNTVNIYELVKPEKLLRNKELIKSILVEPLPGITMKDWILIINPTTGSLSLSVSEQRMSGLAVRKGVYNESIITQYLKQYLERVQQRQKRQAISSFPSLLPKYIKREYSIPVNAQNANFHYWVANFSIYLHANPSFNVKVCRVLGAGLTIYLGRNGQVIKLLLNWRPVEKKVGVPSLFSANLSEEAQNALQSRLCYSFNVDKVYQSHLLPFIRLTELPPYKMRAASSFSFIPQISSALSHQDIILHAQIYGGHKEAQYAFKWYLWDIDNFKTKLILVSQLPHLKLGVANYTVVLNVKDIKTNIEQEIEVSVSPEVFYTVDAGINTPSVFFPSLRTLPDSNSAIEPVKSVFYHELVQHAYSIFENLPSIIDFHDSFINQSRFNHIVYQGIDYKALDSKSLQVLSRTNVAIITENNDYVLFSSKAVNQYEKTMSPAFTQIAIIMSFDERKILEHGQTINRFQSKEVSNYASILEAFNHEVNVHAKAYLQIIMDYRSGKYNSNQEFIIEITNKLKDINDLKVDHKHFVKVLETGIEDDFAKTEKELVKFLCEPGAQKQYQLTIGKKIAQYLELLGKQDRKACKNEIDVINGEYTYTLREV